MHKKNGIENALWKPIHPTFIAGKQSPSFKNTLNSLPTKDKNVWLWLSVGCRTFILVISCNGYENPLNCMPLRNNLICDVKTWLWKWKEVAPHTDWREPHRKPSHHPLSLDFYLNPFIPQGLIRAIYVWLVTNKWQAHLSLPFVIIVFNVNNYNECWAKGDVMTTVLKHILS